MMSQFQNGGDNFYFFAGYALHALFMAMFTIGAILLIIWMVKNLKAKQLLRWTVILLVAGLIGSLITFRSEVRFWDGMLNGGFRDGKRTLFYSDDANFPPMMKQWLESQQSNQKASTQTTQTNTQKTQTQVKK